MHDSTPAGAGSSATAANGFHGIFEKLRQLDIAHKVSGDLYEDSESNFWDDYCGDEISDLAFFTRQLGDPGLRVLDLACGAGRIAIALAREGATVDGLELAPAMLGLAAKATTRESAEVASRLRFVQGDMAAFDLGRRYERIVLGATSICLLLEPAQRAGLFACVARHLAEGGRFLFNLLDTGRAGHANNANNAHDEFMDVFTRSTPDGQDFAIVGQRVDPATGHCRFNVYRERIAWNGDTVRTLGASTKARIAPAELRTLIAQAGLRIDSENHDGGVSYFCVMKAAETGART